MLVTEAGGEVDFDEDEECDDEDESDGEVGTCTIFVWLAKFGKMWLFEAAEDVWLFEARKNEDEDSQMVDGWNMKPVDPTLASFCEMSEEQIWTEREKTKPLL